MKRILVYGDSNTWGMTDAGGRYAETQTWPVILQQILGGNYHVVQNGLPGRIAGNYETEEPYRNGQAHFEVGLRTVLPVEYVIIALGTNDLKEKYNRTSRDIFEDLVWYRGKTAEVAVHHPNAPCEPTFIYVCIPNVGASSDRAGSESLRRKANDYLMRAGEHFIALDNLTIGDDGVHFTATDHQLVAQEVFAKIRDIEAY